MTRLLPVKRSGGVQRMLALGLDGKPQAFNTKGPPAECQLAAAAGSECQLEAAASSECQLAGAQRQQPRAGCSLVGWKM
jgi:hypothetical protein